jgi:hypothetical protein
MMTTLNSKAFAGPVGWTMEDASTHTFPLTAQFGQLAQSAAFLALLHTMLAEH